MKAATARSSRNPGRKFSTNVPAGSETARAAVAGEVNDEDAALEKEHPDGSRSGQRPLKRGRG